MRAQPGTPRFLLLGGSGAYSLPERTLGLRLGTRRVRTPFGFAGPVHLYERDGFPYFFLSRHGERGYEKTARYVNYRPNVYAAKTHGVERIIAWPAPGMPKEGTSACPEGPRLETPAEVRFLARAGADMVGMTLCPEAFLARELEICYAPVAYLTNYAEGRKAMPYRRGVLFEGMLDRSGEGPVENAKNAIPPLAGAAARALAGSKRDCPCAVSMERYRRAGAIGPDFRTWVSPPGRKRG